MDLTEPTRTVSLAPAENDDIPQFASFDAKRRDFPGCYQKWICSFKNVHMPVLGRCRENSLLRDPPLQHDKMLKIRVIVTHITDLHPFVAYKVIQQQR